jgi:hypothetical protein
MQCPECRSMNIGFREKGRRYVHFCHDCGFIEKPEMKIIEVELPVEEVPDHFSLLNATSDDILDRYPITTLGFGLINLSLLLMVILNSVSYILMSMLLAGLIVIRYVRIDFKQFEK